jgi:hypothetical protein
MFLRDTFKLDGYNDRKIHGALNCHLHLDQPNKKPNSVSFLPFVGNIFNRISRVLADTSNLHEIIQSHPICPRPPRTKDTRCLHEPLWVRQVLHWAHGPVRGRQFKGASIAHSPRTSGQVGRSWTQYRPGTPHSIPQCFHPRHQILIYEPHFKEATETTPLLQYQQRRCVVTQ